MPAATGRHKIGEVTIMKKLALLLALCMVFTFALAGCQKDNSSVPDSDNPGQSDNQGGDDTPSEIGRASCRERV